MSGTLYLLLTSKMHNYWGPAVFNVLCGENDGDIALPQRHLGLSPPKAYGLALTFSSNPQHTKTYFPNLFFLSMNFISHFWSVSTTSHGIYPPDVLPVGTSKSMVQNETISQLSLLILQPETWDPPPSHQLPISNQVSIFNICFQLSVTSPVYSDPLAQLPHLRLHCLLADSCHLS